MSPKNVPQPERPFDRGEKRRMKAAKRWRKDPELAGIVCPCGRPVEDLYVERAGIILPAGEMTCIRHAYHDPEDLVAGILYRTFGEQDLSKRDAARAGAFASGNPDGVSHNRPPIPAVFRKGKKGGKR